MSDIRPDDPESIRGMFERLAPEYDLLNSILTLGLVHSWRRAAVRAAGAGPGDHVLDVCTGTGRTLGELRSAVAPGGLAVGLDFSPAMLSRATGVRVLGDALRLPFRDRVFDAVVSTFALRDVADQRACISEMARVTRSGGRLSLLDIGRPGTPVLRIGFDVWFRGVAPVVAGAFGHGESHRFLVRSLDYLPPPDDLRDRMFDAGIADPEWRDLSLGAARLFWGRIA